ncbi:MAG: UvrD-helicase domain-containing protein [Actinomycetota bacterium]
MSNHSFAAPERVPFNLSLPLPTGRAALEASAGTGKTYTLTALIVRYIAENGITADQLLVVTFTRAAVTELRDRTRSMLGTAARALLPDADLSGTPQWLIDFVQASASAGNAEKRRRHLLEAIARFDELAITTIHGFCQQALGQLGLRAGNNPNAELVDNAADIVAEVCRDLLISQLADDPSVLSDNSSKDALTPPKVETSLIEAVTAVISNPGARFVPSAETELVDEEITGALAKRWSNLVLRACAEVKTRQQARGEIGYDSLITDLHDAIIDPVHGPAVAEQLAARFSVVLIDEFQDTDRVQWQVFQTAFASKALITVGDPKQAIYRFRGADVHAYLNAVDQPTVFSLATNHRSDRQLLLGIEHLFTGATLGDPRIGFMPVEPCETAPFNALGTEAAVQLHAVMPHDSLLLKNGKQLRMPKVRAVVLSHLVKRIIHILEHDTITAAGSTSPKSVRPGDIAVLVSAHSNAEHVAAALRQAGIPAVRTRTGSVLTTPAVMQWRLLLTALANPSHAPSVRGAALGWFLGTDPAAFCGPEADATLAAMQERVATMALRLHRNGLAAMYDEEKARPELLPSILRLEQGERHLTDLDHIAELLANALPAGAEAGQVLRVLDEMVRSTSDRSESTMRRIDSDALAVQITTIHSAKGLEYPIVLLPFGFKQPNKLNKPYSYTSPDGARTIDLASSVAWNQGLLDPDDPASARDQGARERRARLDNEGDDLRLLYVALTRAQHRLEVWWASTTSANKSALARILLDRDGNGLSLNSASTLRVKRTGTIDETAPAYQALSMHDVVEQLRVLASTSAGAISLNEVPEHVSTNWWAGADQRSSAVLATASTGTRRTLANPTWKRWSFTRLGNTIDTMTHGGVDHAAFAPVRGGSDEPTSSADGIITVGGSRALAPQPQRSGEVVAHLADAVAGTSFGTFVHTVLEELDFTSPNLETDVRALVTHHAQRNALHLDTERVVAGLIAALQTPLGPLFNQFALCDLSPDNRLSELNFDFPINEATAAAAHTMPTRAIADILLRTLPTADPVRPYAELLAAETHGIDISGWMNGSIDAVFRVPHNDTHKYLVVDYKTNRLHVPGATDPVASYAPQHLVSAMQEHRYPLQALLYTVALHRYLRWRLGSAYHPDQHLGGVGYLFVRGMVGPHTPRVHDVSHGVFSWRPPTETVVALDNLFATGSAS